MFPWPGVKESLEGLVLRKRIRRICQKSNAMAVMNMGTTREIVLNSKRAITKEEGMKPISPKKWKKL